MIPSSLAVLAMVLAVGGAALGAFLWAWRRGQFSHLEEQSRVIFEPRDLLLDRPWETELQKSERRRRYGPLRPAEPGEWGEGA